MRTKTHCKHGHEFSVANVYINPKTGARNCRPCVAASSKKHRERWLFSGNREVAIKRDGEKCVRCGMTRDQHRIRYGVDITVDHMDGRGVKSPVHEKNNRLDNLQTLCIHCHSSKDNKQNKLTDTQVINIRHMRGSITYTAISRLYGVTQSYISQLMANDWRVLTPELSNKEKK